MHLQKKARRDAQIPVSQRRADLLFLHSSHCSPPPQKDYHFLFVLFWFSLDLKAGCVIAKVSC